MNLATFLGRYKAKPPRRVPANRDELRLLVEQDGVSILTSAPALNPFGTGKPTKSGDLGCHLWVIDARGVPHILEIAAISPALESGRAKHTNLTGGEPAWCGGELWFDTPRTETLYVNGCSGRYGPITEQELRDAISVFESLGYKVTSFGWDSEVGLPARVLRAQ